METQLSTPQTSSGRLDRILGIGVRWNAERLLFAAILILTIATRFYDLGTRVMSHDETSHVYWSWLFEQGRGYQHDPVTHGPLQFHLIALSYILFGDNDTSARAPAAVFGVLAVGLMWALRRWLGRTGALIAASMTLISPFILYYSRYARNEAFVVVEGLLMAWAVFSYFDTRQTRWLYLLSASITLHFVTKETAFIYTAQLLLFVGALQAWDLLWREWESGTRLALFTVGLIASVFGGGSGLYYFLTKRTEAGSEPTIASSPVIAYSGLLAIAGLVLVGVAMILEHGKDLRTEFPALDVLIIVISITLPQLTALSAQSLGWDPLNYNDPTTLIRTIVLILILIMIGLVIGFLWDWRRWLIAMGIAWGIFVTLQSSLFTQPRGLISGLVGSLGYWLVQQGVQRGSQPAYYYLLIEIPIYEYLAAIGALLAGVYGAIALWKRAFNGGGGEKRGDQETEARRFPAILFIGFWALSAILIYSYAGEKMPWLTVHIALPMILLAGWSFGRFLDGVNWEAFRLPRAVPIVLLGVVALVALFRFAGYLLGTSPPFQGMQLAQLEATVGFITTFAVAVGALIGVAWLSRDWTRSSYAQLAGLISLVILFALTARTAFRAAYVNYDEATEFLVYAHSASGPKIALQQIEDLSMRTTGGLDIDIGYDDLTTYPFWWYLRNYPNAHPFGANPSRQLLDWPLVMAGDGNWGRIEPILRNQYTSFEYIRIWWPMQDYFNLTWERVKTALTSPEYRAALWDIWLNRDFTAYSALTGQNITLRNWSPSNRFKLYIRKDIAAMIWNYGVASFTQDLASLQDPYEEKTVDLLASRSFGVTGSLPGQFSKPRDVALAPDGSLYVIEELNHRVQHLSPSGEVIDTWGEFADVLLGGAPGGTFNKPWGITVAPDGTVIVADTWNHRIQRFSADGTFLGMFGYYGQAEQPDAFWGPRDVVIDSKGRLFVADTGNKRVVIFDQDGNPLGQFGSAGVRPGELDEPVGLAIDEQGRIYVADTWNQRIQIFEEREDGGFFESVDEWPIEGWYGTSTENKPYLSLGPTDSLCTTDPEGQRVLCFDSEGGEFRLGWGVSDQVTENPTVLTGIAMDDDCGVWVVDSGGNRLLYFEPDLCDNPG